MFWELLKESTIFQGMVTLLLIATICYMFIVGYEVPDELFNIVFTVLAFWFGQKVNMAKNKN